MKSLFESIKNSLNIGRYRDGERIIEDGVPCTVIGRDDEYIYLLSDPINNGAKGGFYDLHDLEKDDDKYNEVFNKSDLFQNDLSKIPVHLYCSYQYVKDFINNDLKRYPEWEIPRAYYMKKLNTDKLGLYKYIMQMTTDCWIYEVKEDEPVKLNNLWVWNLSKKSEVTIIGNVKRTTYPLRLIKKVKAE